MKPQADGLGSLGQKPGLLADAFHHGDVAAALTGLPATDWQSGEAGTAAEVDHTGTGREVGNKFDAVEDMPTP